MKSLTTKIVLASVFSILLAGIIIISLGYHSVKSQSWQQIENESRHTLDGYAFGIGQWVEGKRDAVSAMGRQLGKLAQGEAVYPILQQGQQSGHFLLAYFGTSAGEMYRHDPSLKSPPGFDPRSRGWYRSALSAQAQVVTAPFVSVTANKLVVAIAEPVYRQGQWAGAVSANLALDALSQDIIRIAVPGEGAAMLVAANGLILAHQDSEQNLKQIAELDKQLSASLIRDVAAEGAMQSVVLGEQKKWLMAVPVPNTDWSLVFVMDHERLVAPLQQWVQEEIIVGLVVALLLAVGTSWLMGWLLRELRLVSAALADIAHGDGDLTVRIETRSQDEIGVLARNFNVFISRLHQLIRELKTVTQALNTQAGDVAAGAAARSERVRRQQNDIVMVATAVEQMTGATQEIAANAEQSADAVRQTAMLSHQGQQDMQRSQTSIGQLAADVSHSTALIRELNQHGAQIGTISSTIRDIAEQINLLALNAAIEAARAGEQGRGFAVVADEVRVLSQRTHSSTAEIQTMIETLQQATQQAVQVMTGNHQLAESCVTEVDTVGQQLSEMSEQIEQISMQSMQIAAGAEEQSSATSAIRSNAAGVNQVAESLAEDVALASEQAVELKRLAGQIEAGVAHFKV
ncbi:methyl-accepting chemotaxis protein [Photobacterium atrarenae]|uniref:Methyl-accepting chemotaxis protein n=1 Tax=Photobacterium atrarenae TaxID=865757 RepID=A0ABY5GEG8_9GAMM|nr:methyl-accepting chemotaxis protein [Photobacterium atrarenae]UTV27586.1 methyl-accepting chemotaxis protein [Photobacterium atrarenae]